MQEDKEPLFDAHDTVLACLNVFERMLATAAFHTDRMAQGASEGFTNATDAADYLVGKGVPFRDAHAAVGRLVAYCMGKGTGIEAVPLSDLKRFSPAFEADVYEALSMAACVERRALPGGPAKAAVLEAVQALRNRIH